MTIPKPEVLPDVYVPDADVTILPAPLVEEGEDDELSEESRTSQAIHERRPETSPPVKAVNMPF